MSFESLGLAPALLKSLTDQGYTDPTPVQTQAIPAALKGQDLIVSARTGSGKTAAFLLPALQRFQDQPRTGKGPRLLVLTPTRELARQVTTAAQAYARHLPGFRTVAILGGIPYGQQQRMLARPFDIMVATPGRLLDLLSQNGIDLSGVQMLVLDEADRMLDMGFIDDVDAIVQHTPSSRQTLLFSATVEGDLAGLAQRILKQPQHIEVDQIREQHGNIAEHIYYSDDVSHKKALLTSILGRQEVDQAIVFTATKMDADSLATELEGWGISCAALHGDMRQSARNRTLERVQTRKIKVLVATDVAARGLDVPGISHVVNFDLPRVVEDYIHRIGRTGRGGRSGIAISLVGVRDRTLLARISQYTGHRIEPQTIAGLEPKARVSEPRSTGRRTEGRGGRPQGQRPGQGEQRSHDNSRREPRGQAPAYGDRPAYGERHDRPRQRPAAAAAASGTTHRQRAATSPDDRGNSINYQPTYEKREPRSQPYEKRDQRSQPYEKRDQRPQHASAYAGNPAGTRPAGARPAGARPAGGPGSGPRPVGRRPQREAFYSRMDMNAPATPRYREEEDFSKKPKTTSTTSKITYVSRSRLIKPEA